MAEKDATEAPEAGDQSDEQSDANQAALAARLITGKDGAGKSAGFPLGGVLIKIDKTFYEPSRLTISSFSIHPYDGQLIPGQMFQAAIMLPGEEEATEIPVSGAIKTLDADFGLRAVFASPQPESQRRLAAHLIELRKTEAPPEVKKKKKGLW